MRLGIAPSRPKPYRIAHDLAVSPPSAHGVGRFEYARLRCEGSLSRQSWPRPGSPLPAGCDLVRRQPRGEDGHRRPHRHRQGPARRRVPSRRLQRRLQRRRGGGADRDAPPRPRHPALPRRHGRPERRRAARDPGQGQLPPEALMPIPDPEEQLQFLFKVQRLLSEGLFVSTYKYALLLALADLAVERGDDTTESLSLDTRDLAEQFIGLYW